MPNFPPTKVTPEIHDALFRSADLRSISLVLLGPPLHIITSSSLCSSSPSQTRRLTKMYWLDARTASLVEANMSEHNSIVVDVFSDDDVRSTGTGHDRSELVTTQMSCTRSSDLDLEEILNSWFCWGRRRRFEDSPQELIVSEILYNP